MVINCHIVSDPKVVEAYCSNNLNTNPLMKPQIWGVRVSSTETKFGALLVHLMWKGEQRKGDIDREHLVTFPKIWQWEYKIPVFGIYFKINIPM